MFSTLIHANSTCAVHSAATGGSLELTASCCILILAFFGRGIYCIVLQIKTLDPIGAPRKFKGTEILIWWLQYKFYKPVPFMKTNRSLLLLKTKIHLKYLHYFLLLRHKVPSLLLCAQIIFFLIHWSIISSFKLTRQFVCRGRDLWPHNPCAQTLVPKTQRGSPPKNQVLLASILNK